MFQTRNSLLLLIALVLSRASSLSLTSTAQSLLRLAQEPFTSHDTFLIELNPGETRWVNEAEKWELKRQGINFMDITDNPEFGTSTGSSTPTATDVTYPSELAHQDTLKALIPVLNQTNLEVNLKNFSSFHTRYYKSDYGAKSSRWLLSLVNATIYEGGRNSSSHGVTVEPFEHPWGQSSIIARIPGSSNKTIVIGAHQDSINLFLPSILAAPGADDDGSGTVTILEAFRVLLMDEDILAGNAENTVEFHWYSAEEGGLLGSQAVFLEYKTKGRDVKAMLQQDMTGYIQGTLDKGLPESVGVITDFVDQNLTNFIEMVVDEYCEIPYILTKCGYACSDHASASKAGYPSAFVIESDFGMSNKRIHTTEDKLEYLSFEHMLQHARLTTAFAYELAFAKFD